MDEYIGKLSLYDVLARLIAGGLAIIIADFSKLISVWEKSDAISIIVFALCSYGLGLVLEEISYRWDNRKFLMKKDKSHCDYKKEKNLLILDNREDISDEPLAHVVLADSLKVACIFISFWKIVDAAFMQDGITTNAVINVVVLGVLGIIFHLRKKHYADRRKERMKAYYDAKYINTAEESK